MKKPLVILNLISITIVLVFSSCLKKLEAADNLNTNIFDKEYAGDCWFVVEDTYTYINSDGITLVRVEANLYGSKMPELKPSTVKINCQVNNQPGILLNVETDNQGNYPFYYDAIPETSNQYCLEAGLFLDENDTIINKFTVCSNP